jgi:predicted glycoside hydrolase/deacetylase ChbG (UPF0249 family)
LIVNADDFGLSAGVNAGILETHARGLVTSTSLMVRWPAAAEAVAQARAHPGLDLGLHVDLSEWMYRDGCWQVLYAVVPRDDAAAVAAEVSRQLERFEALVGGPPSHLDSHQHVHRDEPVRSVLREIATRLHVPLRHFSPAVRYCGSFYGQTGEGAPLPELISVDALVNLLDEQAPGITELACHPGYGDDLAGMYCRERAAEVRTLCDPRVREALVAAGIGLCSFRDISPEPEA